jgi:predicted O-methyltransferase YrrM
LDGPFDVVLNDADKVHCRRYVEMLTDKLSERAVILTDNTLTHAAELAEFLAWIRAHPGFFSAHVPIGNGMEMSVRRKGDR